MSRWTSRNLVRAAARGAAFLIAAQVTLLSAQERAPAPLSLLDVPYVSQSEALCGGAAAAMVLRYWGARGIAAESFAHLVDRSAAGIRTDRLIDDVRGRGWNAAAVQGTEALVRRELESGRPVLALIEDRPGTFHYVVLVGWHDRGVVFHDPARAPFRVMARADFDRRWQSANRWLAIIEPADSAGSAAPAAAAPARIAPPDSCEQAIALGVGAAQANQFDVAERTLSSAMTCPGGAALRELAGLRALQKRWEDVASLAGAALVEAPGDAYTWRLLATARFLQDDRGGALDAWNAVEEPKIDLLVVDGLARTRYSVVDRMLAAETGTVLTRATLNRSRRQLSELPSALATRLDYAPVPSGLAEVRAVVVERPLLPGNQLAWLGMGIAAASARELRLAMASVTGGGELVSGAWRFWPQRPRVAVGLRAPAPWGGTWGIEAGRERQSFDATRADAERVTARLSVADWATGSVRWEINAGADRWRGSSLLGVAGGAVRISSRDDRIGASASVTTWVGRGSFTASAGGIAARSSALRRGFVASAGAGIESVSSRAPLDLWAGGDVGHARPLLLRAHPLLDSGRLRIARLGRVALSGSIEGQRWWQTRAAVGIAAAAFADAGRTAARVDGRPLNDVDIGVGARLSVPLLPGVLRLDLARGLRDGATAWSFVYQP